MKFEIVKDNQMVSLQTSDGPFGPSVGGLYNHIWPPLLIKPYNRALGAKGKQKTAAFGSSPPFGALRHHLSPASGGTTNRREAFPS